MNPANLDPDMLASRSESKVFSINRVFNFVYGWMTMGLLISGLAAWGIAQAVITGHFTLSPAIFTICMIAEFILVIALQAACNKLAPAVMMAMFAVYAILNGITLSVIFLCYELATIQLTFFVSAGMFAGMALLGTLLKRRLDGIGSFCVMALWGIIIATIVNFFLRSTQLDLLLSYLGVAVFVGLTAWDAQRIRALAEQQAYLDNTVVRKLGLLGALTLYLDFVNLFLYLLRLLGKGGRR